MRKVYKVCGYQRVEVTKWVKASSEEEAKEIVEDMGICLEDFSNDTVGFFEDQEGLELSEGGNSIEWNYVELDEEHDYDSETERYTVEVWLEGNKISDSGEKEYETEYEAEEEAEWWIGEYLEDNDMEDDYSLDDFEIRVTEL